jgi:hypothetical protein
LQFLSGPGPVLLLNGQETGEPGAGAEGFNLDDGRTTFFDYWAMPEFVKWVNDHRYDGGALSAAQLALRNFYAGLLGLCQDPSVNGDGYWGLKYFNRPERFPDCPNDLYSFARFQNGSGRLLAVVANFRGGATVPGRIRIPPELATAAALPGNLKVQQLFDREGISDGIVSRLSAAQLVSDGFPVSIANQSTCVYAVSGA